MSLKKLFFLSTVIFLIGHMNLFAQSEKVSLSGTIQDAKSGETLPFVVVNIKDSSVLNVISVNELFFVSKSAAGTYLRYFEVFFITACIYLVLTFTVTRLLRLLERKMDGKTNYIIYGSQSDSKASIKIEKEEGVPRD